MRSRISAIALATVLFSGPVAAQSPAPWVLVVHPEKPIKVLTAVEISALMLKEKTLWKHGVTVEPVNLSRKSALRETFSLDVHKRPVKAVVNYWQRQIFSGRQLPPPELESDAEVMAFVSERPGGIGYVSAETRLEGVKSVGVASSPEPLSSVKPRYTPTARRARVEGVVVLRVDVDEAGRVDHVTVVRELAHGLTDEAVKAVRQWRFKPAKVNDEAVRGSVEVTLEFSL